MTNSIKLWTFFIAMAMTLGLLYWAYGKSNNTADYQRTFEKKYAQGETQSGKGGGAPYHGARESDIRKYEGNRYATY